jgi:hypothetical protein
VTSADQEHTGIRGEASGSFVAVCEPCGYRSKAVTREWNARQALNAHVTTGRHRRAVRRILRRESA